MDNGFGTIRPLKQLELENFGAAFSGADEAEGGQALTPAVIREREMAARLALKDKMDGDDLPSWADVFHQLINAGWKWKLAAFAAWSSVPKEFRVPKTLDELATDVLGLSSPRVIFTWRKKYPSLDQVIADLQNAEMLEDRADVLHTLKHMAKQKDYKNFKYTQIYLEMIGAYVPTTKLAAELKRRGVTSDDLADMSDEELRMLAGSAMESLTHRTAGEEEAPDGEAAE